MESHLHPAPRCRTWLRIRPQPGTKSCSAKGKVAAVCGRQAESCDRKSPTAQRVIPVRCAVVCGTLPHSNLRRPPMRGARALRTRRADGGRDTSKGQFGIGGHDPGCSVDKWRHTRATLPDDRARSVDDDWITDAPKAGCSMGPTGTGSARKRSLALIRTTFRRAHRLGSRKRLH